jgi:hypothetical protein
MNHFDYRNGVLHAEAVNLSDLADAVGTPFYCYSSATLERHYRVFTEAFAGEKVLVCYAMKANSNQSVLRTLAKLGAGADVVSGGELKRALAAGIPANKILFSGVGKTEAELRAALASDILCINVESEPELELLSRLAVEAGKTARISVSPSHARARFMPVPPSCRGSRSPVPTCTSAARSPISARWKSRSGFSPNSCRRCVPTATTSRISISAAGSASPITWTAKPLPRRTPMPRWSSG